MHYVYILLSERDNQLYTGCTHDLKERYDLHNAEKVESTKNRRPLKLIYYEASINKQDAFKREKYLKTTYGKRYIYNRLKKYFTG